MLFAVISMTTGCSRAVEDAEEKQPMTYLEHMASTSDFGQSFRLDELKIPEKYVNNYKNEEATLRVEIDVEIVVPDVETLSIYQASAGTICDEQLQKFNKGFSEIDHDWKEIGNPCYRALALQKEFTLTYVVDDNGSIQMVDDEVIFPRREDVQGEFELSKSRIEEVQVLLEDMGITGYIYTDSTPQYVYKLNSDESMKVCRTYQLTFMRSYDDVPSVFTRNVSKKNMLYRLDNEIWCDEQVQVLIDEKGVLFVDWMEPYANVQTYLDDVYLLSFTSIIDLMQQMILVQNGTDYLMADEVMDSFNLSSYEDQLKASTGVVTYHVDKIILGMKKISDVRGQEGLIVPVWDFQGSVTFSDEEMWSSNTFENISILTLNAVDGTVVNSVVEQ